MSLPVFRAVTAKSAGTGATSVALPSGTATGDICVLVATTITGNTISITTAGGGAWTQLTGSPIDTTAGERLYVWWRRHAGAGDTAPTVTPSGDHVCGGMIAYSNCVASGDPIHVVTTSSEATSDTTYSFATGLTSTVNDVMAVSICSNGTDSNTATIGTQANASLASLNTRMDYCTTSGLGGGFGYADGTKVTAGTLGTWSSTLSTASPKAYIGFALLGTTKLVTETIAGIAPFTGGGADVATLSRSGTGISPFTGGGAKIHEFVAKTNAGISAFTGSGVDEATSVETGAGVAPFTGGGADVATLNRTGAGVSSFTGGGTKSVTTSRSGTGTLLTAYSTDGDDFDRADENPLAGSWTNKATTTGANASNMKVASNAALGVGASSSSAYFNPTTGLAANQDVRGVMGAMPSGGLKLFARIQNAGASNAQMYGLKITATTVIILRVATNGSETQFANVSPLTTPAAGDEYILRCVGGAIIAMYVPSGGVLTEITRVANTLITSGGPVGIGATGTTASWASWSYVTTEVSGGADAMTFVESGTDTSPFTGTGSRALEFTKSGAGVAAFTGSGDDATTFVESGTGVSAFAGSGADVLTSDESGTGTAPFDGSGADATTSNKSGAGVAPFTGSGSDADTLARSGTGVAPFTGTGSRAEVFTKSGTGVSGVDALTSDLVPTLRDDFNRANEDPLSGGGNWASLDSSLNQFRLLSNQATTALAGTSGSYWTPTQFRDVDASVTIGVATAGSSNNLVLARVQSPGGAGTWDGYAVRYRATTVSLFKVVDSVLTTQLANTAASLVVGDKFAIRCAGTTIQVWTYSSGAWHKLSSTTDASYASGYVGIHTTDSNFAVDDFSASEPGGNGFTGGGVSEYIAGARTGTGVSAFTGSGADVLTSVEGGTGASPFSGDGSDELTYAESGTGTSPFAGSGADATTFVESGTGVSEFTGASPGDETQDNAGTGVSAFTGSGADATTFVESGTGTSPFAGAGDDAVVSAESGTGVAPFSGGGTADISGGTEYQESGSATAPFTGSGADVVASAESGTGIAPFAGSGARAVVFTKTGAGVAVFSGSGADAFTDSDTGAGVAPFTGSGADATTSTESGTGVAPFTGSGSEVKTLERSGTGIAPFTGSGVGNTSGDHAGAGVAPFSGAGSRAIVFTKSGSGVSARSGSGADVPVYAERGAGVIDTTGGGVADKERAATGTGVVPFTGGGVKEAILTAQTYEEAGTGTIVFSGRGKSKKPHLKGYGRASSVAATSYDSATVAATGADTDIENASGSASTS